MLKTPWRALLRPWCTLFVQNLEQHCIFFVSLRCRLLPALAHPPHSPVKSVISLLFFERLRAPNARKNHRFHRPQETTDGK
jgi:hypothetical protein